jgi:hypothetical protein
MKDNFIYKDFSKYVKIFINGSNTDNKKDIKNTGRGQNYRYASFDYCYNYFYSFYKNNKIKEIANKENLEKVIYK